MNTFFIKKPLITEKATSLNEIGKYVFAVDPRATKNEVKKLIKEIYKVDPTSVNIVNLPPKTKRFRNIRGKESGITKAIVTLKEGQKIDLTK
ncbi:MAG: large subunit ribosomal protein L23 [Parcubacteria group bacterium Gr01-1014_20]|nr:MAG: large subunit ribosomal protein L23 [Parcubacteria group bacterium Gr01-1014_20]